MKNPLGKNISIQKEKGNMSYRQINKDKILFENNFSKKYTVSEGKSNSYSKGKIKLQSTPFNNTERIKYKKINKNKINKINKNNIEKIDNNGYYKKKKNYLIENKDKKTQELRNNSYKSNENNNINFSININFNVNQIKNNTLKEALKEREKTNPLEPNKIKSLKGIKLDLKKINNNGHIIRGNSLSNSERMNYENSLKMKQYLVLNRKTNYTTNEKTLIKS